MSVTAGPQWTAGSDFSWLQPLKIKWRWLVAPLSQAMFFAWAQVMRIFSHAYLSDLSHPQSKTLFQTDLAQKLSGRFPQGFVFSISDHFPMLQYSNNPD